MAILPLILHAQEVTQVEMTKIYEEVKTPYKYGLVIAPKDDKHMADCPTVFRHNDQWYMTYLVFNGRGYETWIAQSDNLLEWETKGRILSFRDEGWDKDQRGGFATLPDMEWGGSYKLHPYKEKYWMTYMGNDKSGYEAEPLKIGLASIPKKDLTKPVEWESFDKPILSPLDKDAQWFEKATQYKSIIYLDKAKTLGSKFIMFYNAKGVNPENKLNAERIGIALSDDIKNWKRYSGNPIFANEVKGTITGDAHIQKMGNLYTMFYFRAFDPSREYKAYNTFACSYDLVNWYPWEGEDLIFPSENYDSCYAHKSYVVKYEGVVYHFYCAVKEEGYQRGIAVATSKPVGQSDVDFPKKVD